MTTTKSSSNRTRSSTPKQETRRSAPGSAPKTRAQTLTADARTAVRSVRSRARRAMRKVPTDSTTIAIAAGIVAAGFAIFMNRDRLRDAATTGGKRLMKAADDLTAIAHERIDQARDNITRFRDSGTGSETPTDPSSANSIAVNG